MGPLLTCSRDDDDDNDYGDDVEDAKPLLLWAGRARLQLWSLPGSRYVS